MLLTIISITSGQPPSERSNWLLVLTCPNCEGRNANEFRFGGEYDPLPKDPSVCNDAEWTDYLYLHNNRMDTQVEW